MKKLLVFLGVMAIVAVALGVSRGAVGDKVAGTIHAPGVVGDPTADDSIA